MSRNLKWTKKKIILYSTITTIVFFIFVELIFRVISWFMYAPYHTNLSIQGNTRLVEDSVLYWNNRPFYLEYNNDEQYNELGMRVKAGEIFMPEKKERDFWIFLLGASAMYGMGSNLNGEWLDITNIYNHSIQNSIGGFLENSLQKNYLTKKSRYLMQQLQA